MSGRLRKKIGKKRIRASEKPWVSQQTNLSQNFPAVIIRRLHLSSTALQALMITTSTWLHLPDGDSNSKQKSESGSTSTPTPLAEDPAHAHAAAAASYITFLRPEDLLPPKLPTRQEMETLLLALRKKALVEEYFSEEKTSPWFLEDAHALAFSCPFLLVLISLVSSAEEPFQDQDVDCRSSEFTIGPGLLCVNRRKFTTSGA
ncbi:hypothetical protein H0H93_003043 [Arthromyces matolae]|nr:hypothetical protein H0H93_003043 [Arthromyces matolae]